MKIKVPTSQKEIPLHLLQEWNECIERNKDMAQQHALRIFAGLSFDQQDKAAVYDKEVVYNDILTMLNEKHELQMRFTHNGVEYGFIPSLDDMSAGEFIDADNYISNPADWHKFLAVLYRPIIKKAGDTYDIESYRGTKNVEMFKELPASLLTGVSVFFCRLGIDLSIDFPPSLKRMMMMTIMK